MKEFKTIPAAELTCNPFTSFDKDWALITAQKGDQVNTMTVSWGGMGVIWHKNVAFIFVRKSRYTKEFIDDSSTFSLTFFDTDKYRKMLTYMGTVSGRTEDKIAKAGLTVRSEEGTPYFDEAKTVLLCRKLSRHTLLPEGFLDSGIEREFYQDGDLHDLYIGEITKILVE